jgi:glycosyltransferase involved in cell wall biosynthesis
MKGCVHIFSIQANHTTAKYFLKVIRKQGQDVIYWNKCPDLSVIQPKDLFLFIDPAPDWPLNLEKLSCLKVAYMIDVHQDLTSRLDLSKFFDVVFVAQKDYVHAFVSIGHMNVYWLPLGCDAEVHCLPEQSRSFDVGFVGKLGSRGSWRYDVLTAVLSKYRSNNYKIFYPPHAMAEVYGKSKIVFNVSINKDLNMRFFEALASGALLVTDRIANGVSDIFREGEHYVGYSNIKEAIQKIDYYLENPVERKIIALEGQRVALAHHTYSHRWKKIIRLSQGKFGQAPARKYSKSILGNLYSSIFFSLSLPKRIPEVIQEYGFSRKIMFNLLKGWIRWLNIKVPFTPNALLVRLRRTHMKQGVK